MSAARLTSFNLDIIAGSLRSQIFVLQNLQKNLEEGHPIDENMNENIKNVEKNLWWLKNFLLNN